MRTDSMIVHKTSAVGKSEAVLEALFARQQQARPHEMFLSPLAVSIALPRLTHERNARMLEQHRVAEFLILTGAAQ